MMSVMVSMHELYAMFRGQFSAILTAEKTMNNSNKNRIFAFYKMTDKIIYE